jgi:hypothetical protein
MPSPNLHGPLSPKSIVMHSVAIAAPPGACLVIGRPLREYARAETCRTRAIAAESRFFPQDATWAARIVDGIAAELTKLARSGSSFGEGEPVIALVSGSRCEEIGFVASFFVHRSVGLWNQSRKDAKA